MYKYCSKCSKEKPIVDFHRTKTKTISECKTCFRERMRQRTKSTLEKILEYKGSSCEACGYNKCVAALEFHHIDPSQKEFSISKSRSRSFEKIKAEIDKCVLLCSNCHREVHNGVRILGV